MKIPSSSVIATNRRINRHSLATAKMLRISDEYDAEKELAREAGRSHNVTLRKWAKLKGVNWEHLRSFRYKLKNNKFKTPLPDPMLGLC